jgi:trk system potassium uptake protein TrkA
MIVSVIGLGKFGGRTATRLAERGIEVIAIDINEEAVEKLKDKVTNAVCLDATDERALRQISISDVDVAIIAIGDNMEVSIMAVAMLRKLGVGRILARAVSQLHEYVLKDIGASEIIRLEEDMGDIVASRIVAPYVLHQYNFAAGYSLVELKLGKKFEGRTLVESKMKQNYSLNVVAIQRRKPYITEEGRSAFRIEYNDNPLPMDIIHEDDILVLVGNEKNFNKLYSDLAED